MHPLKKMKKEKRNRADWGVSSVAESGNLGF